MTKIIDLLREVQWLQRVLLVQESDESDDAFDARLLARQADEDEWIGTLYYKGDSVSSSHSKAVKYGEGMLLVWKALEELGVESDGKTHAADAIRSMLIKREDHKP